MFLKLRQRKIAIWSVLLLLGSLPHVLMAKNSKSTSVPRDQFIAGLHEFIEIPAFDAGMKAKLDTGATTSSMSAGDIERFEKDGQPWVRFRLLAKGYEDQWHELPVARVSRIKRRAEEGPGHSGLGYSERPVVELPIRLGSHEQTIQVGLTDRSRFLYPFLLGASGLKSFGAIVDPSASYLLGKKPSKN